MMNVVRFTPVVCRSTRGWKRRYAEEFVLGGRSALKPDLQASIGCTFTPYTQFWGELGAKDDASDWAALEKRPH